MRGTMTVMLLSALISVSPAATEASPPASSRFAKWLAGPVSVLMLPDELQIAAEIEGSGLEEEFIAWFWSRRDPDATTPVNEFRAEFADRLAFVEKEHPEPERGNAGWATARGLIYLLMGPPDEILVSSRRFVVDGGLRRLVSWQYADPRGGARPVRLCLVDTRSGIKLANDPQRPRSMNPAQALETRGQGW